MTALRETENARGVVVGAPVALWPDIAPGSESWTHEETSEVDPATGTLALKNVVTPSITPVLPDSGEGNGTAVVIAPGGGFVSLAWEHEGMPVAEWFAARGVAAFVLKYRLAPSLDPAALALWAANAPDASDPIALQQYFEDSVRDAAELSAADGEQALRVVRARAGEWGVDPQRVGILGFSAGGTVALRSAVTSDSHARPRFVVNVYGAFLRRDVPAEAPPCFTVVAADDDLVLGWCLEAAEQWRRAGRPIELHVYERGGHGFGLRSQGLPVDTWIDRLTEWLHAQGLM